MFRFSLIIAALATASAAEVNTDAKAGSEMLSKARRMNQNYEDDFTWMTKYSLKFEGCHTIHTYGGEGAQGAEEGGSPFGAQHLAKFKLCATGKCGSCSDGGVYMTELREFAESYLEAKKEEEEANCQKVEENCNCNYYYGDDQACLASCYKSAGLSYCGDNEQEFDPAEYMECREADFQGGNYYNQAYYIGPVCSHSGTSVTLALFTDAQCTQKASSGTYEKYNYGYTLPYSSEPIISTKCMSCKEVDENAYYNGNYYPEAAEFCTQLYEQSAKCEKNMSSKNKYTRDTGSCEYINKIVPALEHVYHKKGNGAATGFAVFFALTTAGALGAAYYFYTKVERSTVDLSDKEGGNFA